MAQKARDPDVKKIFLHVSDEEEHHVGEFEHLLKKLDKDYESNRTDGEQEAKEEIGER
jgi:rubrerythrin